MAKGKHSGLNPLKLFRFVTTTLKGNVLQFLLNPGEDFLAHFYFSDHVSLLLVATFGKTFRTLTGRILLKEEAVSDFDKTNESTSPNMNRRICHFAMIKGRNDDDQYLFLLHLNTILAVIILNLPNTVVGITVKISLFTGD